MCSFVNHYWSVHFQEAFYQAQVHCKDLQLKKAIHLKILFILNPLHAPLLHMVWFFIIVISLKILFFFIFISKIKIYFIADLLSDHEGKTQANTDAISLPTDFETVVTEIRPE